MSIVDEFEKVIEAAAKRDSRVSEIEGEHTRRVELLVEAKSRLVERMQEIDEEIRRVNAAKFSLIRTARREAEAEGATIDDDEPF